MFLENAFTDFSNRMGLVQTNHCLRKCSFSRIRRSDLFQDKMCLFCLCNISINIKYLFNELRGNSESSSLYFASNINPLIVFDNFVGLTLRGLNEFKGTN